MVEVCFLILFIYYINYILIYFCCSLIAEFLLPPSNILPRTYRDLSSIMKEIGMHYEAIHACPDDHVKYYNLHEFAIECLEFHISRYRTDQVTKKVPHKVLHYIPKGIEINMMLFERLQMVLHLEIWRKSGLTLKKNPIILGFFWQQIVLIHLHI